MQAMRALLFCLAIPLLSLTAAAQQACADLQCLEKQLASADADSDPANRSDKQAVKAVESFIRTQRNHDVTPQSLEATLNEAIRRALPDSWSEQPAYVLRCCSDSSVWLVSVNLGYAAAGSHTFLELYEHRSGVFHLLAKTSEGLDNCDTHIVLLPGPLGRNRFLAYGKIFGANQGHSIAVLYDASGRHIAPIWTMKPTLGLRVTVGQRTLVLSYRDIKLFYARVLPDAFADTFEPSYHGLKILSHKPLPKDQQ
jgi:hypothetical protein